MRSRARLFVKVAGATLAAVAFAAACARREPWEIARIQPGTIERVRLADASGLAAVRIRFYSRALGEPRFLIALAPKSGPPPRDVLILDHGFWDRPEDLVAALGVDRAYSTLLARNQVRPALIVLPDVRFSAYAVGNRERDPFPGYLSLVADEVAGIVSREFRVPFDRERWGIAGFSFGGYIALDVARRYPGRFARVSVISAPFYDPAWTFWPSKPVASARLDAQGRGKQTIAAPGPTPRLFLACGLDDRFIDQMRGLHRLLDERGIQHTWRTADGAHTWQYWSSVLPQMLGFELPPMLAVTDEPAPESLYPH